MTGDSYYKYIRLYYIIHVLSALLISPHCLQFGTDNKLVIKLRAKVLFRSIGSRLVNIKIKLELKFTSINNIYLRCKIRAVLFCISWTLFVYKFYFRIRLKETLLLFFGLIKSKITNSSN